MIKFLRKYNYIFIIIVFLVILFITYNSYNRTKKIITTKYEAQNQLIENSIINALKSASGAYSISEEVLREEMKSYSRQLIEKYKDNPDINSWDLQKLKKQMGKYEI